MPIIIKANKNDSAGDVIKKFKKASASTNVVQQAKDRRYFTKPSQVRAQKKIKVKRLQHRIRTLKRMKNITAETIQKIEDRMKTL